VRLGSKTLALAVSAAAVALSSGFAPAAPRHLAVVSHNAADHTPQLVATAAVARPRVDAITSDPATTYAGGLFNQIAHAGQTYNRSNLVAFDTATGRVRARFAPTFDEAVRAVENVPGGGAYVGGGFTTVNGETHPALTKLTVSGAVDRRFSPPLRGGIVYDVELVDGHLIVAGNSGKKLMSLDPATGADDGLIDRSITGRVCSENGACSWGTTAVYDFAVAQGRLAAVGNFAAVDREPRSKFFMLNLRASGSPLSRWYYPGFAKPCATNAPRRIANLQGVDWNPRGTAFSVAATGQIPARKRDIWYSRLGDRNLRHTTVCDAVGRFTLRDSTRPQWINYTGGDSMWTVQDTGAAVYVQGHFKWVNNPDGYASRGIGDTTSGRPAVRRSGIAAIDPQSGLALSWSPAVPSRRGGRALEATPAGLWVGSDAVKFGPETHYGIAFAPAS